MFCRTYAEAGATDIKIILSQGHKQPLPMVGKPLPGIKDLGIAISAADANDKVFLVCFFDINQRPSRNCLLQLSTRAKELMAKNVVVVDVQASKIDESALNEWVKKNNIPFPVGMIQVNEEKTRFSWGVRSLPWLILTDKKHIVIAEGFGVEKLEEELNKIEATPSKHATPINNSDVPKSFMDAETILTNWESSYAGIRTMRVSYCTTLVDYQPPAKKPDIDMTDLVKYQHVQRVEDGERYHIRLSTAEDGFNRPESLTEYAFNGKTTKEYFGSSKHSSIFTGLEGSYAETVNDLKDYMQLRTRQTTLADIRAEYPNGAPELSITFKKGVTRGIIAVRPNLESVAGELCHIVEVTLPGKDHKGIPRQIKQLFWMADDKGMCLMKHQEYWDDRLDREVEVKQIAMTDMAGTGIWYPVKAYRTKFDEEIGTTKYELTVMDFVPNVEVNENTFQLDFIEGTSVTDSNSGKSYIWQKGMKFIVDEWNNSICYVPEDWSIRVGVGKPLPEFEGIDLDISAEDTRDKAILLCFFKMDQRPSRNCMKQLSEKVQELKEKEVVVIAVQTSKADESLLNEWMENNNIPFPVGMVQGDEEKTRFSWGVRSLPWLILTDKEHIVSAEGFGLDELDEKLHGNTN
jgi:peroxiredoxin